jgi:hypothetical protein
MATHLPICVNVLTFDRSLAKRAGDEIVFGIVFQPRYLASSGAHDDALRVLSDLGVEDIDGTPMRYVSIPVSDEEDTERAVLDSEADILYIAPLRAFPLDAITPVSQEHDLLTCSGVGAYGDAGLALAVGVRRGRPEIVIDLIAMREEGVDFTAVLLDYARVVNVEAARSSGRSD